MKTLACLLAVTLVSLSMASQACAADPNGNVDQATLASMGLGGIQMMSDEEGKEVRGTFAVAFGLGTSQWFGTHQTTGYAAGDFGKGVDFAAGANSSQTGIIFTHTITGPEVSRTETFSLGTYAVGSSWAFAGK